MTVHVLRARRDDAAVLADVIASAFHELALCGWLVPDQGQRRRIMPPHFQLYVDHALEYGVVYTTPARTAVAVWFPAEKIPDIDSYDVRLAAICDPHTHRFRTLDAAMHANHPADAPPHEHLALLAVRPESQGAGLGSALLDHHHRVLDARGVPAYLEASSLRSRALYLRHGYRPHGEPFTVPGGPSPSMWPMWRSPEGPHSP